MTEVTTQEGIKTYAISAYRGAPATDLQIMQQMGRLMQAFPTVKKEDANIIAEYCSKLRIPADQLKDAVDYNIINNHGYLRPADILSFGKSFHLLTYNEWCRLAERGENAASTVVHIKGQPFRILHSDAIRFNINIEKLKTYLENLK